MTIYFEANSAVLSSYDPHSIKLVAPFALKDRALFGKSVLFSLRHISLPLAALVGPLRRY